MNRRNISSGAKWESIVGYSRAVQIGNRIEISGTVAADEDVGDGDDFYGQAVSVLRKVKAILEEAGFQLSDVVRSRIYVTDISRWEEVGRAHGEFFKDIMPATSMVEVKGLIDPKYRVEIEITACKD